MRTLNTFTKNSVLKLALGIRSIEFKHYRAGSAHWRVELESGEEFSVITHNLGSETTVLRLAAEKLGKMGKAVKYPEAK